VLPFGFILTLNGFHRRHLRQRDITTGGNASQTKIHSIDFLLPNGFAKPDAKPLDHQSTPPRCQVMAELMNNNEQVEQHHYLGADKNNFQNLHRNQAGNGPAATTRRIYRPQALWQSWIRFRSKEVELDL